MFVKWRIPLMFQIQLSKMFHSTAQMMIWLQLIMNM